MNCADFHNLVVIAIYGRLTAEEREEIDRHGSACAECAALYERFENLMNIQAEALEQAASVPTPDWDKSWAAIEEQAFPQKNRFLSFLRRIPRWVPVTAAILFVFAVGYFAGRGILVDNATSRPGMAVLPTAVPGSSLDLASYADSLKPVLISFLNRGDVVPPAELRALERGIIRDMLSQTRTLKNLIAETGDTELADLLDDLQFILTSMANLEPGDKASAAFLERMIREKNVRLRLRELASPATL
jgi:hypothetical protein